MAGVQFGSDTRNRGNPFGAPNFTQCFQRYFTPNNIGNNTNDVGKLGTTNIDIDEPIVITGYNEQLGFNSNTGFNSTLPRGLYGSPMNNASGTGKLSSTNITVNQPITITEQKGVMFGIQPTMSQPVQGLYGQPIITTSAGTLSTTNIIVKKPITISGTPNTFKFGINPTQATNFGYFNTPITTNALEKLCTTNIKVNKPISITGNFGRNTSCMHNCNCRPH
ncbi:uncharacterized protein LOC125072374 [Vanessa atalanta]|nr:uncharacterized protein LOC125072374 [Vanessa atalanta]